MKSRRISILPAVAVIIMMAVTAACNKRHDTLYPWGWEKTGRPTDSLMIALQDAFLGDTSLDSCVILVNKFHSYSDRLNALPIEKARAIFWDARLAFASENYEQAHNLFRKALTATDSANYPYDARYIHLCLEPLEGQILDGSNLDRDWYLRMIDDLEFSLKHDARILGALRAQYLCCIMTYSGNPGRALHYSLLADSLFSGTGRDGDRLTNRLNVAASRIVTGDTIGAMKDYAWMQQELERGIKPVSPLLIPLMDYNRWTVAKDTTALIRLMEQTGNIPELVGYRAIASAYLAEIELEKGISDSLALRIDNMRNGVDYTDDAAQRAFVLKTIGKAYQQLGDYREALGYMEASAEVAEENVATLSSDSYGIAETERIIGTLEQTRLDEQRKARLRLWGYVSVFILISLATGFMAYSYLRKLHRKRATERKALEEVRRAELSLSLSMQEKERQVEELRLKLNKLLDEATVDADTAREIESSLRSDTAASKADEEFGHIFATISPEFHKRLREAYPRIGRTTLRMAEYIAIGMDNRHIARVMNIRPESVKQNRWRLRQGLGLDTDDNLDHLLRDML